MARDGDGDANGSAVELAGGQVSGVVLRGFYLGKKLAEDWTRKDGTVAHARPKIGLRVDGLGDVPIVVASDSEARSFGVLHSPGELVEVLVIARPPFGSTGRIGWFSPDGADAASSFGKDWD